MKHALFSTYLPARKQTVHSEHKIFSHKDPTKSSWIEMDKSGGSRAQRTVEMEVNIQKIYIQNGPEPQSSGYDESNEVWGHLFFAAMS